MVIITVNDDVQDLSILVRWHLDLEVQKAGLRPAFVLPDVDVGDLWVHCSD